jgi:hypothetical protein
VTTDIIQSLQDDIYFALLGDSEIAGVSIFRRRTPLPKDVNGNPIVGDTVSIEDSLNNVLSGLSQRNGQTGAAIIVMLPDAALESGQNMTLPVFLKWKVRVVENQMFNESTGGTGLSSSQLSLHIAQFLQTRAFRGGNPLRCDPAKAIEEISLPGYLVHEINGILSERIALRQKCLNPTIDQVGATVTLACATPDARLWYTLDQSYPGSGNAAALLYAAPLALAAGSYLLRFGAEADAMQASNDVCAALTIS